MEGALREVSFREGFRNIYPGRELVQKPKPGYGSRANPAGESASERFSAAPKS
jgi:hypothetical protein